MKPVLIVLERQDMSETQWTQNSAPPTKGICSDVWRAYTSSETETHQFQEEMPSLKWGLLEGELSQIINLAFSPRRAFDVNGKGSKVKEEEVRALIFPP